MKTKFIIFVVCLVLLLAFQSKLIMPVVYDIIASDFFMEDTGDELNPRATTTTMTDSAYLQCNNHIANDIFPDSSVSFTNAPLNAFQLGAFQYLVNADIEIIPANSAAYTKRYACRIKYLNNDDTSGISDSNNWSIYGISGLDDN